MATSADILCGLCEAQDITKHADHWCPECEEGLCIACLKYHKLSKATKFHEVISVENFKRLPKSIASTVHHCQEHNKRFQNYCPHHESLCCPICIETNHKTCLGLLAIDNFIKTAKSSSLIESIEENIKYLKRNFQLLLEESDQNLVKNKTHQVNYLEDIKNVRIKINEHFDKLEQKILHELSIAEKQIKDKTESFSQELKEKLRAIEDMEHDVVAVKEYGSDLQTCLGSMKLKTKVEEEEKFCISLLEKEASKQIVLKCNLDENVLADMLSVAKLGTVSVDEFSTAIDLKRRLNTRAQIMIGPISPVQQTNHEIHLTLKCKFELPVMAYFYRITGCAIRPDGKKILVDRSYSQLLIFKERGGLERKINVSNKGPTDVTCVDDKTFCVSYCEDNRLELINTDSFETIQVIRTNGNTCGITSENGTLYWYEQQKGIQMKQQSNNWITTLVKDKDGGYWSYISVHGDRIYQTNDKKKTVSCFKLDGEKIWEFKDKSMIDCPKGIDVDNASNVYIADYNKGVFVVSSDGKNCRQILGRDDGICNCYTLFVDRSKNILLVTNKRGPVFLYELSYKPV